MAVTTLEKTAFNSSVATAVAKVIFDRLDTPRKRSWAPIRPLIFELGVSMPKAGKDTHRNEIERWWNSRQFRVSLPQESAETDTIRSLPRNDAYAFEMSHFSYNFKNLEVARASRSSHLVILNRGPFDNLWYLEWNRRRGAVSNAQFETFKSFLLGNPCGPWTEVLDGIISLNCTPEESLRREYGSEKNIVYGSRMNPKSLALMESCKEKIMEILTKELPNLPVLCIDTTHTTVEETRDEIIAFMIDVAQRRFSVSEDEILLQSPELRKEKAVMQPPALKFKGAISHNKLRSVGWTFESSTVEKDTYLTPRGVAPLTNDECYHVRESGKNCYFVFKWGENTPDCRSKIAIPINADDEAKTLSEFEAIVTLTKERERFRKDGFLLVLDNIDQLGGFIEITAPTREKGSELLGMVHWLGFQSTDIIPESYLRLWLKNQNAK